MLSLVRLQEWLPPASCSRFAVKTNRLSSFIGLCDGLLEPTRIIAVHSFCSEPHQQAADSLAFRICARRSSSAARLSGNKLEQVAGESNIYEYEFLSAITLIGLGGRFD
jgi:hypothetical protein